MNVLNKLFAAISGELLFKVVFVLEKLIVTPIIMYELLQTMFLWLGLRNSIIGKVLAKVLAGVLVASLCLLFATVWVLNPFYLLGVVIGIIVSQTIEYGFKGASTGWEYGFEGVFTHCANTFNFVASKITGSIFLYQDLATGIRRMGLVLPGLDNAYLIPFDVNQNIAEIIHQINMPIQVQNIDDFDFVRQFLHQLEMPVAAEPNRIDLSALELSEADLLFLRDNQQHPLNADEMERLESDPNADIKKRVADYKSLWCRLETSGECMISLEKPEKKDAVLLVKLYQREDGQEFSVPGYTHLFDKTWLAIYFDRDSLHPVNRDLMFEPSGYQEFPTRYVCHPYYYPTPESSSGISQELSEKTDYLRSYLARYQQQPPPQESERNRMIAARLRAFAPVTSGVPADTRGNDIARSAEMNG